jgi:predicted secreted protein
METKDNISLSNRDNRKIKAEVIETEIEGRKKSEPKNKDTNIVNTCGQETWLTSSETRDAGTSWHLKLQNKKRN